MSATLAAAWPFDAAGSEAHRLVSVWWLLIALGTAVAVIVLAAVVVALFRRPRDADEDAKASTHRRFIIGGGLVLPVVVLSIVAVATVDSTATLRRPPSADALRVEVVAEQWFWRLDYPDAGVTTANELRLPVGRPVALHLRSNDVVHSFWVPQLAGKLDVVPGSPATLTFTPQATGTFRGECAEFCGLQHANMNFVVDVLPQADFDQWLDAHRNPPPEPSDPQARAGRDDFASLACAGCHTIRGLTDGKVGPDLTDVGGRAQLGAGVIENNADNLAAWINNARAFKAGAKMPPLVLTADQIT
ncbi:MAG TPA: cytochrome c oxidase subunit II, partial [Jatrophihabitantaceae bacterium]|nr:cytochrome c oxidase subunit II [Jatrophihabitantaceae bacterium]